MLLDQYYSYKIVCKKLLSYSRLKRMKPLAQLGMGKDHTKDICIEGSHTTHRQNVSYLFYNNLVQSPSEKKPALKRRIGLQLNPFSQDPSPINKSRVVINPNSKSGHRRTEADEKELTQSVKAVSVQEIESVTSNLGRIFNEEDLNPPLDEDSQSRKSFHFDED